MDERLIVRLSMVWWWTWFYWPVTRFGIWLGLPLCLDRVAKDTERAIRVKQIKDEGQPIDSGIEVNP
jgi:hypothetical protein